MIRVPTPSRRSRKYLHYGLFAVVAGLLAWSGCNLGSALNGGNGDANSNDNGAPGGLSVEIISFKLNTDISQIAPPVNVFYTVSGTPTRITAVYQEVADGTAGAGDVGDPVVVVDNLGTGVQRSYQFDPQSVERGWYRFGLEIRVGETVTRHYSTGSVRVQAPPSPVFRQPAADIHTVMQGDTVFVVFDAQDPENDVQWRLFYLTEAQSASKEGTRPDQLGTQLLTGSGNFGSFTLSTTNLAAGRYELGVSATDTGRSVVGTAQEGNSDRIRTTFGKIILVELPPVPPSPPSIAVTQPDTAVSLFRDEAFTVRFQGALGLAGTTASVELFYDTDRNAGNGFTSLAADLPLTTNSFPFPTNLEEGTYQIGAQIVDSLGNATTSYSAGSLTVVRDVELVITEPDISLPLRPGTTVPIEWSTTTPADAGTVDVYWKAVNEAFEPIEPEHPILTGEPLTTTTASFQSLTSGLFAIFVRINLVDGTELVDDAPDFLRYSSLPAILWVGSLATNRPAFGGAIFEGVNFEDNTGTAFSPVGDLDGDGTDEFMIAARYGKPFFVNPTGVGSGEAYLVYGRTSRLRGRYNLNSLGTSELTGVTFTGIRIPQSSAATDGMTAVSRIPDVDGDGRDELVFGFPKAASRGHNVHPRQNGVVDPRSLGTLEREDQFLRGGVVIVSSRNTIFSNPDAETPVINLDLVGQRFDSNCVGPDPAFEGYGDEQFYQDVRNPGDSENPCSGGCAAPNSGGGVDATNLLNYGFSSVLARDYFATYIYSAVALNGAGICSSPTPFFADVTACGLQVLEYCSAPSASCEPFSPGLLAAVPAVTTETLPGGVQMPVYNLRSGFYVTSYMDGGELVPNFPQEPLGARIIGLSINDEFGTSVTLSNAIGSGAGDIIVSAPERTARGILLGPLPQGCDYGPDCGGEINGLESSPGNAAINFDAGVAYLFPVRSLWTNAGNRIPPKPHQYVVGEASHCGGPASLIENIEAVRIAGISGDKITNIHGVADFNRDGRDDFAIGAPDANAGQGRLYIAFRREPSIEGDYVLEKLALDPMTNPDRLEGVLIVSDAVDSLGASLASGVDFNGDGVTDLVVGSPGANAGIGEIHILFGDANWSSPLNGHTIQDLLTLRNPQGLPRAVRITGNELDVAGQFGFNVANAGDVDGDGKDDLLVAAPGATPRYDLNPSDQDDALTEKGLDLDLDGRQDDVSGPFGAPDGVVDSFDDLDSAGIVYLISSRNRLDRLPGLSISIDQLGRSNLLGFMVVGRAAGDRLGGGDAGDTEQGGNAAKVGRGRSFGLSPAGDVDGDGRADFLVGSVLADPRVDPNTGEGTQNAGESYLIYGAPLP
jgi:hypothetical protein